MRLKLSCFYFLLPSLILKCSAAIPVEAASDILGDSLRVRVRRQDGYVYKKPSVSFDLPQSSTPAPTQAPNVDRTLVQQMYYAYPAPAGGGDTVNIGQTVGTTATAATAAPTAAGGYNYRGGSTNSNVGYNYGTASSAAQANTGSQTTTNTGTSQGGSGYGSNVPSPTLSPTLQSSSDVSTSAPKYLPPTAGGAGGNTATVSNANVGGVSVTSGSGQVTAGGSTSVQTGSVETPSDTYLPPLGTFNTATSGQTVTSTGSVSIPSSAYLPPNTSSPPLPAPTPGSPSPQPAPAPPADYIPPSAPNPGTVSTPASTYLPPSFF